MISPIKPRGTVHFSIPVSDLELSQAFYTELLGFKFERFSPAYQMIFLTAGKDYIVLCKSETQILPNKEGGRRVHHAFAIDDSEYDASKNFLIANGVPIFDEEDRTAGTFPGRQFYIHDPDKNVIEFTIWNGREF